MDMKKNIKLICNVCGNDQFSIVDDGVVELINAPDETKIKCSDCGTVTTKEQLIEDNKYIINANINDFKKDFVKQLQKELKKKFK